VAFPPLPLLIPLTENILAGEVHMRGLDDSTLDIISETIDTLHSFLKKSPKGVARLLGNEVITEILGWLVRKAASVVWKRT
jgi:hypothetical protein